MISLGKAPPNGQMWCDRGERRNDGLGRERNILRKPGCCNAVITRGYYEILGPVPVSRAGTGKWHAWARNICRKIRKVDAMLERCRRRCECRDDEKNQADEPSRGCRIQGPKCLDKTPRYANSSNAVRKQMLDGRRRLLDDQSFRRKTWPTRILVGGGQEARRRSSRT
ncbi:hypothetical protein VTI74DRAFT_10494 [Chaetomium olivicolor]